MDQCSKNMLACIVEGEGFDRVLTELILISFNKSKNPDLKKSEQKQWRKASDRVLKLRDWCDQFGPGSGCL